MKAGVAIAGNKKEAREFNGRRFVLEPAIAGDVALVRAWKVDEVGNCVFRYAANNFSTTMAKNAKLTIVEVSVSRDGGGTTWVWAKRSLDYRRRTSSPLDRSHRTRSTSPEFMWIAS